MGKVLSLYYMYHNINSHIPLSCIMRYSVYNVLSPFESVNPFLIASRCKKS